MYQLITKDVLELLNIKAPEVEGFTLQNAKNQALYLGNLSGTEEQLTFYCNGAVEGSQETKSIGFFVGTPAIPTFRQVTEKLFTFKLNVYCKGYNQYNTMSIDCKAAGKTADVIKQITDRNQVLAVKGELGVNSYISKKTMEEISNLELFVNGFNFAGIKQPKGQAQTTNTVNADIPF
jgi:hypothetical protein